MRNVAIIPARGGSTRIPRKNIKTFHGRPIIAYSIRAALHSGLFETVVVSTDDDEIARIAYAHGASAHTRHPDYADDEVGTQEVVREYLNAAAGASRYDYACCIYATAPLMRIVDLREGYLRIATSRSLDYVLSVGYPPLQDAGQFYWGCVDAFRDAVPLIGLRTGLIPVPAGHVCDINTMDDWRRAEDLYRGLHHE